MVLKRFVLFDIDGTLLNGGKLWREVFEAAFSRVFPEIPFPRISFSGKTDRQICGEVLDEIGFEPTSPGTKEITIDCLIDEYLGELSCALRAGRGAEVELLPGVREILEVLRAAEGVRLGLLTGNVRAGAALKLDTKGLCDYFGTSKPLGRSAGELIGAFGDDHADRYQLPTIAVARAEAQSGIRYFGKEVVIIGDTPHDVNCGRSIGVKAIAVGTGRPEYHEALRASDPDHFFNDLAETERVLRAVLD